MIERPPIHLMIANLVLILVVAALGISPLPERLNRSLSLASNYYKEGLYQQALVHYRAASAWQPYRVDIHEKLASSAIQVEDFDLAFSELQPLAQTDRLSPEGWMLLGDLHLHLKHPELALQAYEKIDPDAPAASASSQNRMRVYAELKNWEKAVDFLSKEYSLSEDPEILLLQSGFEAFLDPSRALTSLESNDNTRILGLKSILAELTKPGRSPLEKSAQFQRLGRYYESLDVDFLAEAAFRQAVTLAPDSAVAHANLGRYLSLMGTDGEAEINLALEMDPKNPMVNQLVGEYWLSANHPEIALVYLKKALQLDERFVEARILLGYAYNQMGEYPTGLTQWVDAAVISENPGPIWRQIGEFCIQNQIYLREFGLDAIQALLLSDPESAQNLDLAGRLYLALEDPFTGEKYLHRAIATSPEYYPAHLHLGAWLISSGRWEDGRRWLESAANQQLDGQTRLQALAYLAGE